MAAPSTPRRAERRTRRPAQEPVTGLGARVREAREQAGMSGSMLGKALGLDKSQISKIEADARRVSARELPLLAEALRVTPQWLMGVRTEPAMALAHRLNGAADTAAAQSRAAGILRVEALLTERWNLSPLTPSAAGKRIMDEIRATFADPPRTRAEAQRQGRRMAEMVRAGLNLGSDELGDLADLIEMHFGADVVLSPLGTNSDGLCAHVGDRAVIVASSDFDAGHVRFTLAHELGHHLVGDPREVIDEPQVEPSAGSLEERRVSAFAAHLLIPHEGVKDMLAWLNVSRKSFDDGSRRAARGALALMARYGASAPATVYQLADFGYIGDVNLWVDRVTALANRDMDKSADQAAQTTLSVMPAVRPPRRLFEAAVDAAVAMRTGTGPLAVLLEREDEDGIFDEYVAAGSLLPA